MCNGKQVKLFEIDFFFERFVYTFNGYKKGNDMLNPVLNKNKRSDFKFDTHF